MLHYKVILHAFMLNSCTWCESHNKPTIILLKNINGSVSVVRIHYYLSYRNWIFRSGHIVKESTFGFVIPVRPSIRLSFCPHKSARLTVSLKSDIGEFYENLSINPYLVKIGQIIGRLTWLLKCVLLLPTTLIRHARTLFDWSGIRLIG
jgi:hypothetical protein